VYRSVFGTDDCLEEALANAFSFRWMRYSETARKTLSVPVRDATTQHQSIRLPHDPPGYNQALHYIDHDSFKRGESILATQVNEGVVSPRQRPDDFALATQMTAPFYTKRSNIWIVVERGKPPALPTGIHPLTTCSTRQMQRILESHGYKHVQGSGKGSHVKLSKSGERPIILPGNRKNLSPGVTREALTAIDHRIRDLPDLLKD
jgi:predicted RNA binding protein YcfA (HicA-like mRNA interferase family)